MLDDLVDTETGVAVAATAAVLSSRARHWLREGAVYGVAGVLVAADAMSALGRGVARGVQRKMATSGREPPREQPSETATARGGPPPQTPPETATGGVPSEEPPGDFGPDQ